MHFAHRVHFAQKVHFDGSARRISLTDQLERSARRISQTDQLDGSARRISWTDQFAYSNQFAYSKIDLSVRALSQLPSPTKALLVKYRNQAFSQKAPIKVFCFCLILAQGTPIKRAEKTSQRGQDEDGKKIRVSCVLGFEHFSILWIINEFLHLSTPLARIFFSPSS